MRRIEKEIRRMIRKENEVRRMRRIEKEKEEWEG